MHIELIEWPSERDWMACKERALITTWKDPKNPPTEGWKHKILEARHSPIRRLHFSFRITGIKSWISVHLCRHIHAQPYVSSQRNDRQDMYDRDLAFQAAPVNMIWDINAEELMVVANKRLCTQAQEETRAVVAEMCRLVEERCPEFKGLLVPMCEYQGHVCHEMKPCGRCDI